MIGMDSIPAHWLLVSSPENFETSRRRGFDLAGMKARHRKKADKVRPGDTVLFYLTGLKAIGGLAEVTGGAFEDETPIWTSKREGEDYPFRFPIRLVAAVDSAAAAVPVEPLVDRLTYVKRWPREHWTLAFQGNVHQLDAGDHRLLADAVLAAAESGAH